jgi:PAS domain-containing protein
VIGGTREQSLHRADLTLAETIAEYLAMAIGRTRLHEESREIGRSYQAVVERVREVIFHLRTEDLAIVFLNPAWSLRLGYPEGSYLGRSLLDVVFPDDRARLEASLKSLATNGGRTALRIGLRRRRDSLEWLREKMEARRNPVSPLTANHLTGLCPCDFRRGDLI